MAMIMFVATVVLPDSSGVVAPSELVCCLNAAGPWYCRCEVLALPVCRERSSIFLGVRVAYITSKRDISRSSSSSRGKPNIIEDAGKLEYASAQS